MEVPKNENNLKTILDDMKNRADYVDQHTTWPECSPTIEPREVWDWIEQIKKTSEYRNCHEDEDEGFW